jgi:hypothetical protein
MQRLLSLISALMLTLAGLAAQITGDSRAMELIEQARTALGGEKLAKVHSLSAAGTFQREVGDRQMSGELTIDLQLPDKMLRTDSMSPMGDATIITLVGINGEQLLRNTRTIGGGPNMIVRMAPPSGPDGEVQALRNQRAEMTRLALAFLLVPPAGMPLDFAYGGEAEADEGKADIIDAKGPGSFAVRLFLDRKSHRPLMLSYRGVAPRMVMQTQRGDAPPPGTPAQPPPPSIANITIYLDDYKSVDGVTLPHRVVRAIDGVTSEEWTLSTVKVNPSFKADAFSGR